MLQQFKKFILKKDLLQKGDRTLLAVSGGIDSVAMCAIFHQAGFDFGIAHCNFSLRGADSDGDEAFVKALAEKYAVPYYTIRFKTADYAAQHKLSIQVAARDLRYEWLEQIRHQNNFKFIATAHHANDVAETMLYNLTKGTGIAGLHGILAKKGKIIRPLLFATKAEIMSFVSENSLKYRVDASNKTTKYSRNKIRHRVIPFLKEINPDLEHTFTKNAQRFSEIEIIYQFGIQQLLKKLIEQRKNEQFIPIRKLQKLPAPRTVLYEILKNKGFHIAQVDDILNSLDSPSGKVFYSTSHQVLKERKHLIIGEKQAAANEFVPIAAGEEVVKLEDIELTIRVLNAHKYTIPRAAHIASLDASKVEFPLLLRRWKKGDYFYPFGMKRKKKKVARFFIDQKLSRIDKERVWILTDKQQRIVWVVGHRIDERFRLAEGTKEVLQIRVSG